MDGFDTAAELGIAFAEFKAAQDERLGTLTDAIARLEAKAGRPGAGGGYDPTRPSADSPEFKAFIAFARRGKEGLTADEFKSLRVADDTAGGYLAPPDFIQELIKNLVVFSPVRQAARVGQTSLASVRIPKRTANLTAAWVGETETRSSTGPTFGQTEIIVAEAACYVDISNQLLEDSAIDVNAELALAFGEEFGRLEGAAFVNGTGVKQPVGFMTEASLSYTASGAATTISADSLIDIQYALKPFYRGRATWMMNAATLGTVRKLKDGVGQYLWRPGIEQGEPDTLLSRPVLEAPDMPDIGAGTFPIAFGDFSSGYRIYDRIQLSLLRDPYSVATSGLVRFHARRRVGGAVVLAEAIRKLKVSVS